MGEVCAKGGGGGEETWVKSGKRGVVGWGRRGDSSSFYWADGKGDFWIGLAQSAATLIS